MPALKILGGTPLRGTVAASGSKNAVLPIMAASILADGPVHLHNVPRVTDVDTLALVLADLGVSVARPAHDELRLATVDPTPVRARYGLVRRMRASFCVVGPLLARRGKAVVSLPGGCKIGDRPVDLHLGGLAALGASLRLQRGYIIAEAKRLRGASIDLRGRHGSTVTGTANVLSAAVLARGTTTIRGAAMEPEIVDLGRFLQSMGARISGLATPTLRVEGVERLRGTTHRVIPDRIEAATLLLAAAITGGAATVTHVVPAHLDRVLQTFRAAGCQIESGDAQVRLQAPARPRPLDVVAEPYPGIPTDLQAQLTALLALAPGRSTVRDTVFPARFMHVAELNRLGARIDCHDATAVISGVDRLGAANLDATDLRASAAMVLAALAAEGPSTIHGIHHLDRGHQRLDEKLRQLGANIERVEQPLFAGACDGY